MKKIMFNDEFGLTKAVLEGRKTQTRRVSKIQQPEGWEMAFPIFESDDNMEKDSLFRAYCWSNPQDRTQHTEWIKPAYKDGEIVAVAQRYCEIWDLSAEDVDCGKHQLEPNGNCLKFSPKGVDNKMFVRPEYMPHQIKITNVRLERLQDITYKDCLDEGIVKDTMEYPDECHPEYFYHFGLYNDDSYENGYKTPQEAYAALIDKISGKGIWGKNPWVWVYEFELIK